MARTLEDLLNDLLVLEGLSPISPACSGPAEPHRKPNSSPTGKTFVFQTRSTGPVKHDLPQALVDELQLPDTIDAIYGALKVFQFANRHRPYRVLKNTQIAYIEREEHTGIIRIYLGGADSFKLRGKGSSAAFAVDTVYELQYCLGTGQSIVRLRKLRPQDLLGVTERAQGSSMHPFICFSLFDDKTAGVSTHIIKPEYMTQQTSPAGALYARKRQIV